MRIVRLIKSSTSLRQIFNTFILAIPELANLGVLIVLFLFIFSVLGVTLFAEIKLQENLDRNANFQEFSTAALTLLRAATGENWALIMNDAARG